VKLEEVADMRRAACFRVFGEAGLSLLMAFSVLATSVACSRSSPSRNAADFSVVVVTLDTTRADRIGAFGGTAVPTPRLDEMARQGTAFTAAFAQAPLTLPSHASIFTSKYPASHGVRHNGVFRLRGADTTLAERLKEASFATAAVIGAFVLNSGYGIEQGFDVYSDIPKQRYQGGRDQLYEAQRTADEVNAEVFRWLDSRPAGRILDNVILVVAGDHGESLGSHLELTHGVFLYEPAVHVPLLMRAPGLVPEGRRIDAPVELVPTVHDLLKVRQLRPGDPRAPFYLAHIALLRNREPEAREFIAESLRNDPEFLPPLLNYAQRLATRGRRAEAIGVRESALERRPGDPNAKALLESQHTAPPAGGGMSVRRDRPT
jgi:hypothetical protein